VGSIPALPAEDIALERVNLSLAQTSVTTTGRKFPMLFLRPPVVANDIREFVRKFSEGIRVEYKSTFDGNVRKNTAKMVSSFANSLGGVAVIGVHAINGAPQEPIEGFEAPAEELALVVEQICLQGINPPVIPKIYQIPSDVPGRCFLVIEIDESPAAPHAIENQKRVYVRTGNSAIPYDLAEVDTIIELFTRRRKLQERRDELVRHQRERAEIAIRPDRTTIQASVGPTFPHRPLASREDVWQFASTEHYRGGRFMPGASIRRTNDGVSGATAQNSVYMDITQFGFVLWKAVLVPTPVNQANPQALVLSFSAVFECAMKALMCSSRLYGRLRYRGPIQVALQMEGCYGQSMPFIPDWEMEFGLDDFRSVEPRIHSEVITSAELLGPEPDLISVLQRSLSQLCWSFWQSQSQFDQAFDNYITTTARNWGFR
jgi:hypothetical protein